jgi:hypothetical protein
MSPDHCTIRTLPGPAQHYPASQDPHLVPSLAPMPPCHIPLTQAPLDITNTMTDFICTLHAQLPLTCSPSSLLVCLLVLSSGPVTLYILLYPHSNLAYTSHASDSMYLRSLLTLISPSSPSEALRFLIPIAFLILTIHVSSPLRTILSSDSDPDPDP